MESQQNVSAHLGQKTRKLTVTLDALELSALAAVAVNSGYESASELVRELVAEHLRSQSQLYPEFPEYSAFLLACASRSLERLGVRKRKGR